MNRIPENALIFEHKHIVKIDEIDNLNHVNNVVYLQWINDISMLHWNSLATEAIKETYIWVVIRHEIDYLKPAFLDEQITIKTWIETLKGIKSIRVVHIYRDEMLLAKSKTTWCLLDAKTQKITRVTKEMEDFFKI
jgi:acyl-CoA thioester hydrolase